MKIVPSDIMGEKCCRPLEDKSSSINANFTGEQIKDYILTFNNIYASFFQKQFLITLKIHFSAMIDLNLAKIPIQLLNAKNYKASDDLLLSCIGKFIEIQENHEKQK